MEYTKDELVNELRTTAELVSVANSHVEPITDQVSRMSEVYRLLLDIEVRLRRLASNLSK